MKGGNRKSSTDQREKETHPLIMGTKPVFNSLHPWLSTGIVRQDKIATNANRTGSIKKGTVLRRAREDNLKNISSSIIAIGFASVTWGFLINLDKRFWAAFSMMRAGRFWVGFKVDNLQSERNQKEYTHFLVDNFKQMGGLGAGTSSRGASSFKVTFISELVAVKVQVIYPVVVIEVVPNWAGRKSAILLLCDLGKSVNQ
ncbi:uncharacterized protein MELLADRAFT_113688 [Melampsora larici-populina 98AG31]|uniref:Uncharacterized protein n=1 Tax=Melampsora larici-populina (strain 98AG31 / pathotype 3-4-7) TaxID=747676 RepID=F4SAR7_MELLP|nr:uncharacterized protein MELLADRAFT_113688 [Melampsora larici-populina 98AG31]EGF98270.1 hypothetical protein MELLADRAFT_113688 [Melampsora larici-populina 98AG31]